ncbi:MAG: GGDEF domain-containing protein [Alphaproteobacteria bacterium]
MNEPEAKYSADASQRHKELLQALGIPVDLKESPDLYATLTLVALKALKYRAALEEKEREIAKLQDAVYKDEKTGLPNANALDAELANMLARRANKGPHAGARKDPPGFPSASLVFVDLDDFGAFNNLYSHDAGDVALKHFARTLRGTFSKSGSKFPEEKMKILLRGNEDKQGLLRDDDVFGRLQSGADEFAIVMYDTSPEKAQAIMQRVKKQFEKTYFTYRETLGEPGKERSLERPLRFSFTFGVTPIKENDTISALRDRASSAMKSNKRLKNIDVLTGAHTPEAASQYIEELLGAPAAGPISVAQVDVTNFVNLARNQNEDVKNRGLHYVANKLQELDEDAYIAHHAGGTFLVVMKNTSETDAKEKLDKFSQNMGKDLFEVNVRDENGHVTSTQAFPLTITHAVTTVHEQDTLDAITIRLATELGKSSERNKKTPEQKWSRLIDQSRDDRDRNGKGNGSPPRK